MPGLVEAGATLVARWQRAGLDDLVQHLRAEGFAVGTSETIDAARLLGELARRRPDLEDVGELRTLLRPVLCKSQREQKGFDRVFEKWASEPRAQSGSPQRLVAPGGPSRGAADAQRMSWLRRGASIFAVVMALGIAAVFVPHRSPTTTSSKPKEPIEQALPAPAAPPASVPPPAPVSERPAAPPAKDDIQIFGYFPQVRYTEQVRAVWLWLLLGIPFLFLLAFELPQRLLAGGKARRSGDDVRLRGWARDVRAKRLVLPLNDDTGGRLLRHVRGPSAEIRRLERRPQLHMRRTLDATVRNLGIPTPRYRDARLVPSYLALVEAESPDDLAVHWAERLIWEGLDVDLRRIVRREGETRIVRLDAGQDERGLPLEGLPAPSYGQRLVIVSEGAWMTDKAGERTTESLRARFTRWPNRVFFTALEPRRWGLREKAIERPERTGDRGFLLLPIDENALDAWSKLLVSGRLPSITLESPQQYPRIIHDAGEEAMLAPEAPEDLSKLIAQLKLYLGPNGYFWLCCCAVPPVVHPGLTLLLGESFLRRSGAIEGDLGYYVARNYRLLERLPWIRERRMPEWLRVGLLASVSLEIQQEVRAAVEAKLAEQSPDRGGNLPVSFEAPPARGGRRRSALGDSGDSLYLGFVSGLSPEQLALRMPSQWLRWIRVLQPKQSRWRVWARKLEALWDRLRFRGGLSYRGPQRWALASGAVWLVAAVVVLGFLARSAPADFSSGLRKLAFEERSSAVGARHEKSVLTATFSPDGSRIVTASSDHTARVWNAATGAIGAPLRHEQTVWAAKFSPDGARVVTASGDKTARMWNAATGAAIGAPLRHEQTVWAATFSPDGTRVVTASGDKTARVWDAATGAAISEPLQHKHTVWTASFSPDGTRVVTASSDNTARVWNAATGASVGAPLLHQGPVYAAAFSPDGTRVVTASADNTARVWNAATGAPAGAPLRHEDTVYTASFSPDGTRVVTASSDGTARVWNAATGASVGAPMRHEDAVWTASFSPDGTHVVTASVDRTARVWNAATGEPVGAPLRHEGRVNTAAFSPDGSSVVTASGDHTARMWDAAPSAVVGTPLRHEGSVSIATFSSDGTRVVTASADYTARVWDAATGAAVGPPLRHEDKVWAATFSPDGTRVVTASADNTARVWDAATGVAVGPPLRHERTVWAATFSPDGSRVVTASTDSTARVWNAATGAAVGTQLVHGALVGDAKFSADGTRVVTASYDRTARVWDAATGAPIGAALRHEGSVNTAAFSPDGTRVVTASDDQTAQMWDAATGAAVGPPLRHTDLVLTAAFSPDGTRVVTASFDDTARVWDAATGAAVGAPLHHGESVHSAAFSSDGTRVVTASYDGTARVWDGKTGELLGVPIQVDGRVLDATFSSDGGQIIVASATNIDSKPPELDSNPPPDEVTPRSPSTAPPPNSPDPRQKGKEPQKRSSIRPSSSFALLDWLTGTAHAEVVREKPPEGTESAKPVATPSAGQADRSNGGSFPSPDLSRQKRLPPNAAYIVRVPPYPLRDVPASPEGWVEEFPTLPSGLWLMVALLPGLAASLGALLGIRRLRKRVAACAAPLQVDV